MKNKIILTSVVLALSGTLFASGTAKNFLEILNAPQVQTMNEEAIHLLVVSEWKNLSNDEKAKIAEKLDILGKADKYSGAQKEELFRGIPNNSHVIESIKNCITFWRSENKTQSVDELQNRKSPVSQQ